MKHRLLVIVCIMCLFACKHSKYDREAIKLNDSAVAIQMHFGMPGRKESLNDAIVLFNKAIEIDTNYIIAYLNMFNLQNQLHHYKDAIATAKKLEKLVRFDGGFKTILGEDYERIGDTITAKRYYNESLLYFNKVLDTIKVDNYDYNSVKHDQAMAFILLHQSKNANSILTMLYDNGTEPFKEDYKREMNISKTRDSLLGDNKIGTPFFTNSGSSNADAIKEKIQKATSTANIIH